MKDRIPTSPASEARLAAMARVLSVAVKEDRESYWDMVRAVRLGLGPEQRRMLEDLLQAIETGDKDSTRIIDPVRKAKRSRG